MEYLGRLHFWPRENADIRVFFTFWRGEIWKRLRYSMDIFFFPVSIPGRDYLTVVKTVEYLGHLERSCHENANFSKRLLRKKLIPLSALTLGKKTMCLITLQTFLEQYNK